MATARIKATATATAIAIAAVAIAATVIVDKQRVAKSIGKISRRCNALCKKR